MTEVETFTLQQISDLMPKGERDHLQILGKDKQWITIRKIATDYAGSYIVRAFRKVDDHYEETDVEAALEEMSSQLMKKVNKKTLVKEILRQLDSCSFFDMIERLKKQPKITVGVQKGSCIVLYVRGKQGIKAGLQLTP